MKTFIKYFVLGVILQILVVTLIVLTGFGDIILLPYTIPYELLGALITLPDQVGSEESIIIPIIFLCIPSLIYSVIFGLIMYAIKRRRYLATDYR